MSLIPNNNNSAYDPSLAGNAHDPAFSGLFPFQKMTYNDFLPEDTAKFRSTQKKKATSSRFNSIFSSPTYKDFMPQYPLSNKKNMSVSAWIGSILGGTVGISFLAFFSRAHFNGGLFKDGIKNTWHDFTKFLGITSKKGTGGTSTSVGSTHSSTTSNAVLSSTLSKHLDSIKTQFNPGHVFTTQELKDHFFQEDSKQFQQTPSNFCYILSGLGAMLHHQELDEFLKKITITRIQDGFAIKSEGQATSHTITDAELLTVDHGIASNSVGNHLYIETVLRCKNASERGQQDDAVFALQWLFGKTDGSTLQKPLEEAKDKWFNTTVGEEDPWIEVHPTRWDQVSGKLVPDENTLQHIESLKNAGRLELRPDPAAIDQLEGQEFAGKDRDYHLNDYLQWLKKNPQHRALLMAHSHSPLHSSKPLSTAEQLDKAKYGYGAGHWYAVIPEQCANGSICLMNTRSMGKAEHIDINEFFNGGHKLWIYNDELGYPGNHLTNIQTHALADHLVDDPRKTLNMWIERVERFKKDKPEDIRNELQKLSDALVTTPKNLQDSGFTGNLKDYCNHVVPKEIRNTLTNLYLTEGHGLDSPFIS